MQNPVLATLGWSNLFLRQMALDEIGRLPPVRISAVHRARLDALGESGALSLGLPPGMGAGTIAVGDWALAETGAEPGAGRLVRILERTTLIARRPAGGTGPAQPIAANVDHLLIVTACAPEFRVARLERYLALAASAGVDPVIVLTKADLAPDPTPWLDAVHRAAPRVPAVAVDALSGDVAAALDPWIGPGRTAALVGSSGVGKSTLAARLSGRPLATAAVRAGDGRGRHTTTVRQLLPLAAGGWLIDTPGMRELGLTEAAPVLSAVFAEIDALAAGCRFSDCAHDGEPGCAVAAAVAAGGLDPARLARWRKLGREAAQAAESKAQARARGRAFGRMARAVMADRRRRHETG